MYNVLRTVLRTVQRPPAVFRLPVDFPESLFIRSHTDEFGDFLTIEFSEFRKFGDNGAHGDRTDPLDGVEDFHRACVGRVCLNGFGDLCVHCFDLCFQAFEHRLNRLADL